IQDAVVQTVGTALPKLYFIRLCNITAPIFGAWNLFSIEFALQHFQLIFKITAIRDDLALRRNYGTQLAAFGPGMEVTVAHICGNFHQVCFYDDLPFHIWPEKMQTRL